MKRLAIIDAPPRGDEVAREIPGAQALRRGLSLLDIVAETPGLRFSEIADRAGLTRATAHRMLATLVEAGLLRTDERDQRFHLGFKLFEMAHRVWDQFDLRSAAEPELERLCDLADETVRLAILEGDDVLYIDQRESLQVVRLGNGVGARASAYASGAGKAILAHLDPLLRDQCLNRLTLHPFTARTITDRDVLVQQLDLTKARGYAVSADEQNEGISSVAAPILDHRARAIGAIAIVGPSYRLGSDKLHMLGRDVMEAARRISGNAGQVAMSIAINPRPRGSNLDEVSSVVPTRAFLGEGPLWLDAEHKLAMVDILAPAIIVTDPQTGVFQSHPLPELTGVIVTRRNGGLLAAMQTGIKTIDRSTGVIHPFAAPEASKPGNRFNDGKCDRKGRFWVGSLAIDTTPGHGALYRVDPDGQCTMMESGFHVSNGLGWSPDNKTFYFTDSGVRRIYAFDFDFEAGHISNRRLFVEVPDTSGIPNGLTVDADGFVWSALWDGWCVTRYDPQGRIDRVVNLPVPRPTSCAFGGEGLQTLFITSARIRLSVQQLAEAPLSGSVFALQPGAAGIPETPFAG